MMRRSALKINFLWTLMGQAIYTTSQWGIVTVLARQGSPAAIGEYALALALTGPVIIFLNLKLRAVQASDAQGDFAFSEYLGMRIVTALLALVVIAGITGAQQDSGKVVLTIAAVAVAKTFESISDILYGLHQKHERMDLIAISMIAKGILALVGFYFGFHTSGEVFGGAIGVAVAFLTILIAVDIPIVQFALRQTSQLRTDRIIRPAFSYVPLRRLALLTLPLGLTVMLGSLSANIPRYFIEHYLGVEELGVFAALAYPLAAGGIVISALAQSTIPRLAVHYSRGDQFAFRSLVRRLCIIGFSFGAIVVIGVLILGRPFLRLAYGEEYASYYWVFLWLSVVSAIGYSFAFLGTALHAMRWFRAQLPVHVSSIALLTILSWSLVPTMGFQGIFIALTCAAILEGCSYFAVALVGMRRLSDPMSSNPTQMKVGSDYSGQVDGGAI